jgi:hypothetical protein
MMQEVMACRHNASPLWSHCVKSKFCQTNLAYTNVMEISYETRSRFALVAHIFVSFPRFTTHLVLYFLVVTHIIYVAQSSVFSGKPCTIEHRRSSIFGITSFTHPKHACSCTCSTISSEYCTSLFNSTENTWVSRSDVWQRLLTSLLQPQSRKFLYLLMESSRNGIKVRAFIVAHRMFLVVEHAWKHPASSHHWICFVCA